jgi:hypothetical protein
MCMYASMPVYGNAYMQYVCSLHIDCICANLQCREGGRISYRASLQSLLFVLHRGRVRSFQFPKSVHVCMYVCMYVCMCMSCGTDVCMCMNDVYCISCCMEVCACMHVTHAHIFKYKQAHLNVRIEVHIFYIFTLKDACMRTH